MLQSMLDQATKENIRRMREGKLGNAEAVCRRRIEGFDDAVKEADLNADLVADDREPLPKHTLIWRLGNEKECR